LVAAALVVTALVAVITAAQAAPSTKIYNATVHVTSGTTPTATGGTLTGATLTFTLANDAKGKQTLGSANFTPPTGVTLGSVTRAADLTGWTATVADGVVKFRSTSNALTPGGAAVSADVTVGITSSCSNATWTPEVKQSNDFSGQPGNNAAINLAASNLRPLGKFTISRIQSQVGNQFAPQILVNQTKPVNVNAFDLCGIADGGYGTTAAGNFGDSASLAVETATPARLVGAGLPKAITSWPAGTASMKPVVVETVDRVVATDAVTGINVASNDFDVVEKICVNGPTDCEWDNSNKKIHVDAPAPPPGASLGVGFSSTQNFSCDSTTAPLGGELVYINPRDYPENTTTGQFVAITYDKSIPGTSGNAANFSSCISKNNGVSWTALGTCANNPPVITDAPCTLNPTRVQGNLVLTLFFDPDADPVHGGK